jgi:DNA-binding transcriptional LysR family regulator
MWGGYGGLRNAQIDVRQIRQIIEISRQGGIGRAARELGISQPALSRSIARLEDQLGAVLFERSGEGAKPTTFADYIVSRAVPAMESMSTIAREVRMMAKGEAGRLRIGIGPVIRDLIFPDISVRIVKAFPKLSLRVFIASTPELMKDVASRTIDIAICSSDHLPIDIDDNAYIRTGLFSTCLSFFVRPDHPILRRSRPASTETILDFPMVGVGLNKEQRAIFPTNLSAVQRHNLGAYQVSDYDLVRHVLLNSDAIGYAPDLAFAADKKAGRLHSLKLDFRIEHHCVALTLPESWHSPIVRSFVSVAREVSDNLTAAAGDAAPHA